MVLLDLSSLFGFSLVFIYNRYAKRPDQWKSRQESKESAYNDFFAAFGPKASKSSRNDKFLSDFRSTSQPEKLKEIRKEIGTRLASAVAPASGSQFLAHASSTKLGMSGHKRAPETAGHSEKFTKHGMDDDVTKSKSKKQKKSKGDDVHNEKPSKSRDKKEKKRKEDGSSKS